MFMDCQSVRKQFISKLKSKWTEEIQRLESMNYHFFKVTILNLTYPLSHKGKARAYLRLWKWAFSDFHHKFLSF